MVAVGGIFFFDADAIEPRDMGWQGRCFIAGIPDLDGRRGPTRWRKLSQCGQNVLQTATFDSNWVVRARARVSWRWLDTAVLLVLNGTGSIAEWLDTVVLQPGRVPSTGDWS